MRPDKMSYTKAIAITEYWRRYDFKGRFKTLQTKLAEEFLANPSLYAKKYNINNDVFYSQKSRNKKKKSKAIVFKNDRCYLGGKPIEQVKDAWRFLPCLPDTIDFYN